MGLDVGRKLLQIRQGLNQHGALVVLTLGLETTLTFVAQLS